MTTGIGAALLVLYGLCAYPLYRAIRAADRPRWLMKELNVEYLLLTHIVLLLAGGSLLIEGLIG